LRISRALARAASIDKVNVSGFGTPDIRSAKSLGRTSMSRLQFEDLHLTRQLSRYDLR
jgi:hypothetical protein